VLRERIIHPERVFKGSLWDLLSKRELGVAELCSFKRR
jgi:hypothetical protein